MDTMQDAKRGTRRHHDPELKRQVLEECALPGASVAQVALTHSLNANLVHKWRRQARPAEPAAVAVPAKPEFLPLAISGSTATTMAVRIEVRRAGTVVNVDWPLGAMPECATWLREILR